MAKKALSLRVDEGLLLRVRARADELGQSLTTFVVRALERALSESPSIYVPGVGSVPDDEGGRRVAARVAEARRDPVLERQFFEAGALEKVEAAGPAFRCPVRGCEKRFGSGAASCPVHGRKAVPV